MNVFQGSVLVLVALLHDSNASERLIGAQTATISQFSYLVQLQLRVRNTNNFQYHCTGTLVSKTRLVTAAHCFDGLYNDQPFQWKIRVGATNRLGTEATAYTFDPTVIRIHESYKDQHLHTLVYDIATVSWQFPLSGFTEIQLHTSAVPANRVVTIAGWGGTNLAGAISNPLQFVNVPVVDTIVCRSNYAWHSRFVAANMMCAGVTGRGSCTNDRGLPLIYNNLLAGISAWTIGCGSVNLPGVFTAIPENWVL